MKLNFKLAIAFIVFGFSLCFSQIAIGKQNIDGAGILDFALGEKKGIILPWTNSITNPSEGTFTFDLSSNKVVYFGNNQWNELTDIGLAPASVNNDPELADTGVIIGSNSSSAKGVLVLESNSKALILPKVNNASVDIYNPSPGTICYDLSVNAIAVFNGSVWSYWK